MSFLTKLTLFPCAAFLAGMILSGCGSTEEPPLTDNPDTPAMTETSANTNSTNNIHDLPAVAPRFQAGEMVNVSTSTGSELYPGPIAAGGQQILIAEDGTITLPLIGKVQAAGKTPGELQDDITKLYVPAYFVSLAVTVTAQSRVYYVGGEVMHPGPEVYIGETTVTKAIQAAGDFTQFANHKKVWLTRADGTRIKVNVDKALGDSTADLPVFPGDQIYVKRRYF